MTGSDTEHTEELFFTASELPRDQRAAFLDEACAGDALLRSEIESLLLHDLDDTDVFSDGRIGIFLQVIFEPRTFHLFYADPAVDESIRIVFHGCSRRLQGQRTTTQYMEIRN